MCKCSGINWFIRFSASESLSIFTINPLDTRDSVIILDLDRVSIFLAINDLTSLISSSEVEIKMEDASESCSACAIRSHATVSGSEVSLHKITISEGPAIESIPTSPKSCFFASAT